jgi:hypothetical protein
MNKNYLITCCGGSGPIMEVVSVSEQVKPPTCGLSPYWSASEPTFGECGCESIGGCESSPDYAALSFTQRCFPQLYLKNSLIISSIPYTYELSYNPVTDECTVLTPNSPSFACGNTSIAGYSNTYSMPTPSYKFPLIQPVQYPSFHTGELVDGQERNQGFQPFQVSRFGFSHVYNYNVSSVTFADGSFLKNEKKSKYRIKHKKSLTGYLKVWIRLRTISLSEWYPGNPEITNGYWQPFDCPYWKDLPSPSINQPITTELPPYVWQSTTVDPESDEDIFGEISAEIITSPGQSAVLEIYKWSYIEGYEPEDPIYDGSVGGKQPCRPNGWPIIKC